MQESKVIRNFFFSHSLRSFRKTKFLFTRRCAPRADRPRSEKGISHRWLLLLVIVVVFGVGCQGHIFVVAADVTVDDICGLADITSVICDDVITVGNMQIRH